MCVLDHNQCLPSSHEMMSRGIMIFKGSLELYMLHFLETGLIKYGLIIGKVNGGSQACF